MLSTKFFLMQIALLGLTILALDIGAAAFFPNFIKSIDRRYLSGLDPFIGRAVPRNYFRNSVERGFDISPRVRAMSVAPFEFPQHEVWTNSLGCYDNEWSEKASPEIYLAGDSFTWGYAPFERKFGTLLEGKLNIGVMKCGVVHTGQRHQFSKFVDITKKIGRFPKLVIVNIFSNDIANDFAYPHSKVLEGWLLNDTSFLKINDTYFVRRIASEELQSKIEQIWKNQKSIFHRAKARSPQE